MLNPMFVSFRKFKLLVEWNDEIKCCLHVTLDNHIKVKYALKIFEKQQHFHSFVCDIQSHTKDISFDVQIMDILLGAL